MENKLSITAIILMIAGFTYFGLSGLEPNYYCSDKEIKAHCFDLSGGTGTRCYTNPTKTTWKVCSEGWKGIPSPVSFSSGSGTSGVFHCNSGGCE